MKLSEDEKLELGIEIIAAIKANCYNVDIEEGRIMALEGTEIDRTIEGSDKESWDNCSDETKKMIEALCMREKKRLHNQAYYVSNIALKKIVEILINSL